MVGIWASTQTVSSVVSIYSVLDNDLAMLAAGLEAAIFQAGFVVRLPTPGKSVTMVVLGEVSPDRTIAYVTVFDSEIVVSCPYGGVENILFADTDVVQRVLSALRKFDVPTSLDVGPGHVTMSE